MSADYVPSFSKLLNLLIDEVREKQAGDPLELVDRVDAGFHSLGAMTLDKGQFLALLAIAIDRLAMQEVNR